MKNKYLIIFLEEQERRKKVHSIHQKIGSSIWIQEEIGSSIQDPLGGGINNMDPVKSLIKEMLKMGSKKLGNKCYQVNKTRRWIGMNSRN